MLHINAPDEKTILIVRKHWFILLQECFGIGILFFVPFALYAFYTSGTVPLSFQSLVTGGLTLSGPLTTFLGTLWALGIWMLLFRAFTNYYLDLWIITDKRIVAIDQVRFFHRFMSVFRLERIQDVVVSVNGIIPTMLGFGNLRVETAGQDENFIIRGIPHPQKIKDAIMRHHDSAIGHERGESGV